MRGKSGTLCWTLPHGASLGLDRFGETVLVGSGPGAINHTGRSGFPEKPGSSPTTISSPPLVGEQLRYLVTDDQGQWLALLGWRAARNSPQSSRPTNATSNPDVFKARPTALPAPLFERFPFAFALNTGLNDLFHEPFGIELAGGFRGSLSPAIINQQMRIMNTLLTRNRRWFAFGLLVAGLWLAAPTLLQAGESIMFSREKPRSAPEKGSLAPRDGVDGRTRLGPISPFDLDLPNQTDLRPGNATKDRRQKAAEMEKKNWMVYSPGELQEREDDRTALGIRELDLEKDDGTVGSFFAKKDDDNNRSRQPSSSNRPGAPNSKPPGDQSPKSSTDDNSSKQENADNKDTRPADASLKALLSKGNDLRLNLASGKSGLTPGSDASDVSSLRALVAGSAKDRSPVQPVRQQNDTDGRLFSGSASTLKPSGSEGIGLGNSWRTDYSAKPSTPGFAPPASRASDDFSSSLNGAAGRGPVGISSPPSGLDGNFGRNLNPYNINAPSPNNPAYQRPTSGGGLGTPSGFPQQQPSPLQRTTRETFSIPSR